MALYYAAIDFGTTYTGLAYASKGSETVNIHIKWPDGPTGIEVKAPTVALFNRDKSFKSFGYEAKRQFLKLSDEEKKDHYYFEKFKMELHNKDCFDIYEPLQTSNNKEERKLPMITVFTGVIKYLKEKLLEILKEAKPNANFKCDDIQWIITVPAIWKSGARQLMREAAIKAGLLERNNPRKLIIALEPEAAAIYVKKDKMCDFKHYIIIDCGGGTIDICIHEVVEGINDQCTIREKAIPSGGDWGGINVDKNFVTFLEKIFSSQCINKIKAEEMYGWHRLMEAFQDIKRHFKCSNPIETDKNTPETDLELEGVDINIGIVEKIESFYEGESLREILKKCSKEYGGETVTYRHGQLQITKETMKSFFAPVILKILQHLKDLLKTESGCRGVQALYLVGGFSECTLLKNSVKNLFEPQIKVVVPFGPQTAIVHGAVLYGMQPQMITERVATITYGIGILSLFKPNIHNEKYRIKNKQGIDYCRSLFYPLLKKNTIITSSNHECPINLNLLDMDQTEAIITLYTSDDPNITYVDQGAQQKGLVKHKIPNPGKGYSRHVKVVLDFSGTEIYLIVTDTESDVISYDTIDFLHTQY